METHVAWREVHAPWQRAKRAEKGHSGQAGLVTEAGRPGHVQDKEGTAGWTAATGTRVTLAMALPCTGQGTSQGAHTQGLTFVHRRGRAWAVWTDGALLIEKIIP